MHRYFLILLSCCFFHFALLAQEKKYIYKDSTLIQEVTSTDSIKLKIEPEKISAEEKEPPQAEEAKPIDTVLHYTQRSISADTILHWKNEKAFGYASYLDSLLRDRQHKEKLKPRTGNQSGPGTIDRFFSSPVTKTFFYILGALFVLFILYRLFLAEGVFKKPSIKMMPAVPEVIEEDINARSDFAAMINQAIRSDNYRLAVRYQYLRTLHLLASKNYLQLAPDKTNYQYVREISNPNQQNEFSRLTMNYEYVWYGAFAINERIYHRIENDFSLFNKKV